MRSLNKSAVFLENHEFLIDDLQFFPMIFPWNLTEDSTCPGDPGGVGRFLRASPAEALDPSSRWASANGTWEMKRFFFMICYDLVVSL